MPDFTNAISKGLDARRRVFHGDDATLVLMVYARPGRKGYDAIADVTDGWHLSSGKEPTDPMVLEITESETVTKKILDDTRVFGINGIIYKLTEDGRKAPTYAALRRWTFQVVPSGEAVER